MPKQTLFFIDDDDQILKFVSSAMQKAGYRVLTAVSGPEALMMVEDYQGPIDLVISDLIMPGIKGNDLAVYLKSKRPETKIIFMSGYAESVLEDYGIDQNEVVFLHKPFTLDTLFATIQNALTK